MSLIYLSFDVKPTDSNLPLTLAVELNEQIVWPAQAVCDQCTIKIAINDLIEQPHSLRWIVSQKAPHYTQIDTNGNIVSDSMLCIQNIMVDDIDISAAVYQTATYTHDFNGSGNLITDKMSTYLGCNGVAELKFRTPVYLWLLENL
jgi:hypothetical protein